MKNNTKIIIHQPGCTVSHVAVTCSHVQSRARLLVIFAGESPGAMTGTAFLVLETFPGIGIARDTAAITSAVEVTDVVATATIENRLVAETADSTAFGLTFAVVKGGCTKSTQS